MDSTDSITRLSELDNRVAPVGLLGWMGWTGWITGSVVLDYEVGWVGQCGWTVWITGLDRLSYEVGQFWAGVVKQPPQPIQGHHPTRPTCISEMNAF